MTAMIGIVALIAAIATGVAIGKRHGVISGIAAAVGVLLLMIGITFLLMMFVLSKMG